MTDYCPFCENPAHHGACAALIVYTEDIKARMYPHLCPDCGDLTISDRCPACVEWEGAILDRIVHDGLVPA